jgi:flagellar M-ring protein FliF
MPDNVSQIIKKLSPRAWAMVGGAIAAGIVFLVLVMHFAAAPSYSTLETGLDPAQTGKITSTLSTQGIAYQLQNNGTALAVNSSQTAQARVALATAGLLTTTQPGYTLLDKQSLGQSDFQQQITYERALEGQLDSTIETIDGVSSAEVNLTLPNTQDELFSSSSQQATASVLLSGSSDLQSSSVRGIAQLVASSVPGLNVQKVTITGADGSLLWPSSNAEGADSGGLPAKQAVEQRYDSAESAEVNAMLAQTLGAGKAQAVVNADLDANRATKNSLVYAKKGTPLSTQTSNETLSGAGAASAAAGAGTSSNIPAYTAASSGKSGKNGSTYDNATANTSFGVDKTVTHSVIAPGAIQQQSVSVLVDKSVPAASIPAIKKAVANAVDLQPKRGDTLAVSQIAFAPVKTAAPAAASPGMLSKYGKYLIGVVALAFLAFAGRALRKRERETFGEPTWLRELQAPRTLASLEASSSEHPTEVAALQPRVGVAKRQIEDLVQRDPEVVAQHLRAWMAED